MSEKEQELKDIESYKEEFSLNPSSQLASEIADIYESDENIVCAYRYRLKAIKLEPNNLDNYLELFETLNYYIDEFVYDDADDKDTPKKEKKALEKLEKYEAMAIEHYKKAFALNPSSQIAKKIAIVYESNDKMVCAYKYRLKAIKLEPNNLENYRELFNSLNYYTELTLRYPDDKDFPKKVENTSKKLKKYKLKAIPVAKENLKENPNDYDILCRLSDLYLEEDEDKALDYAQRAFEIDKETSKAYYSLKYLYGKKEDYKKLIELHLTMGYYKEAVEIYKVELKDYHKAIECYLNVDEYYEAAEIYRHDLRDFPKAIECYYKAVESNDKKPLYNKSLGYTLNYIKEHEKALHYLKIAKELEPNDEYSYIDLVYVYNDLGNYEEVRKNLNIAYEMNPDNPDILITKMEVDLILNNSIDTKVEKTIIELFSNDTEVMAEYSMLKILFNITQNKDMKAELLKWKEEYERLSDSYSLVGLKNWAKKQDEDLQDRLLEALRVFK